MTDTDLSSWFSPLINSIANDGTVPYLINTKERYRASPLASTIIWLSHENLLPIEVLDKMQNALLFLRDSNVPLDAQQPNGQKKPEDVNGWSLGEGVSVWSTSMAIIALLDPLGNGKAKANMYKSSILWLAAQHDPSTHGWAYQSSENCNVNAIMTALALRALALAIEPNNRAFFSFTPDEFRTICSSIQAGFKYLQSNCVVRKRKVYWTFNQTPNCAATTWALLALNQINLTDERIADECKSFYKSILKRALSFIISKMPRTPTKWADEQIVCEAGAKYRNKKIIILIAQPSCPSSLNWVFRHLTQELSIKLIGYFTPISTIGKSKGTIRLLFVRLRTQWFYLPFSVGYDVLAKIFPYCYYDLTQQQPKSKRY